MVASPDPSRFNFAALFNPATAMAPPPPDHLLRVAASVSRDANAVWTELWATLKPHVTPGGMITPELENGFVPACGWPEFLEKFWLLKHYVDSIERICKSKP